MMTQTTDTQPRPILWSFRRCPYAMRARMALHVSAIPVEHREILLRDKPAAFLATSAKATVPVLDTGTRVIEESLDIMLWALAQNDPEAWLDMPEQGDELIAECDGPFKKALDRYKYATRYDADPAAERERAAQFLRKLDGMLAGQGCLFGPSYRLADMAVLTFVRQYAHVDLDWFSAQDWPDLASWLERFKADDRFRAIMAKHPIWTPPVPA